MPEARIKASSATWKSDAEKVAALTKEAGCDSSCRILVIDCITTDGSTSRYGIEISDQLSKVLTELLGLTRVVSRGALLGFLEEQRIPSKILAGPAAARWLGEKLQATAVIVPSLVSNSSEPQNFRLFKVHVYSDKTVVSDEMTVPLASPTPGDLEPSESVEALIPRTITASGEPVYKFIAKDPRMVLPRCGYSPQPPYSDKARVAKASGSVAIDAIIAKEGSIQDLRVARGLPWGLNETVLKTLKTWRCGPALLDGKPVAVETQFEVTYRLY
jgi:hypothetical protein